MECALYFANASEDLGLRRVDVRSQRRVQILEAAQRLVAEKGWPATTYADICREAGISNGVLTYHFKSKEDIRFALFELELETWRREFQLAEETLQLPPSERAQFALRKTANTIETRPEFYQTLIYYLANSSLVRPDLAERIRDFFAEIRAHIAEALADEMDRGHLIRRDPNEMASVIQGLIYGYAVTRVSFGINPPLEDILTILSTFIDSQKSPAAYPEVVTAED
jgi:AcrR family transcriptional regulator